MATVHGKAAITAGGKRYNTQPGATLKLSGDAGTPVNGDGGLAGMQYEYNAGQIDCTIIASGDVSAKEIMAIKDAQVSFDSDNGKSYISSNASRGAVPELSKDGWKVDFHGDFEEA